MRAEPQRHVRNCCRKCPEGDKIDVGGVKIDKKGIKVPGGITIKTN